MPWTLDQKHAAIIDAPLAKSVRRADTQIIARPGWYQIITPSAPGTYHNEVLFSQVEASDAERVISEAIAVYAATGHPTKWSVGPWTTPEDFGDRLTRRGFSSWATRGMGCDTTLEVTGGTSPTPDVEEAVSEDALDAYAAAALGGWEIPEKEIEVERVAYRDAFRRTPRIVRCFTARLERAIVGTAAIVMRERYGYLVGAQVLASVPRTLVRGAQIPNRA